MCGITGCWNKTSAAPPSEELVRKMLGQIRHRGPDEFGIFLDNDIGLGNARLSIVDLAGGQQPISNEKGDVWVVFNGEIFNHPELRNDLIGKGHRFTTRSDTEVLVHLYEEHGTSFLEKLNGQFVFAIWDAAQKTLFIARDRVGVRPLFFAQAGPCLLFASEIKALFADPGVERALDPTGVGQVFDFWSAIPPRTSFRGVSELPPGHFLLAREGEVEISCYWQIEFSPPCSPSRTGMRRSEASLADELAELLVDATRIRLRADVPVGAYLSGGLDSSTIAAIVRHLGTSHLDTFSIAFDDPDFDESGPQRRMAAFLGTEHQVVRASHADIATVFPEVLWHTETPLTRTAPAPMFLLSRLVRERGYKVVLTGEGADEFLCGYDIFKEAKIRRFWSREPHSRLRPLLLRRLYPEITRIGASAPAFLKAFFAAGLTETSRADYSHLVRWKNNHRTHRFFSNDFAASMCAPPDGESALHYPASFQRWDSLQQAQYIEASLFLPGYLLSSQGDRVAMAHAVEGRYPFLDHRVVSFCNSLPSYAKMPALRDKAILRAAAARWLPVDVTRRRKRPYRAPIYRCFGASGAPSYAAELFSESSLKESGMFLPQAAARLYQSVRDGRNLGETDEMALIGILSTEILQQRFVTRYAARPALEPRDKVKCVDRRATASRP